MACLLKVACLSAVFLCAAAAIPNRTRRTSLALAVESATAKINKYPPGVVSVNEPPGLLPPPGATKQNGYDALRGHGGGIDVLSYNDEHPRDPLYRPWKTRFDLRPYDVSSPDFLKAENRLGYRKYYAANPYLALAPNARDRAAQSTTILAFGATALASIAGGVLIVYNMQVLRMEELHLIDYQKKMMQVIMYGSAPWALLAMWLFTIFLAYVTRPMRYPETKFHWQCEAMAWVLVVSPLVHGLYYVVAALWLSKLFYAVERQAERGVKFSLKEELNQYEQVGGVSKILIKLTSVGVRYFFLLLEVITIAIGFMFVNFRYYSNSQFCQPEVYWNAAALVATAAILLVFTALAVAFSLLIRILMASPWMQDFVDSFRMGRMQAKAEALEKKEAVEAAREKAQREQERYEESFRDWEEDEKKEWERIEKGHEKERQRHAQHLQNDAEWEAMASQKAPERENKGAPEAEFEPITLPSIGSMVQNVRDMIPTRSGDDDKLEVWPDERRTRPATSGPNISISSVATRTPLTSGGFPSPFGQAPMQTSFLLPPQPSGSFPMSSNPFATGGIPTLPPQSTSDPFVTAMGPPASGIFLGPSGPITMVPPPPGSGTFATAMGPPGSGVVPFPSGVIPTLPPPSTTDPFATVMGPPGSGIFPGPNGPPSMLPPPPVPSATTGAFATVMAPPGSMPLPTPPATGLIPFSMGPPTTGSTMIGPPGSGFFPVPSTSFPNA